MGCAGDGDGVGWDEEVVGRGSAVDVYVARRFERAPPLLYCTGSGGWRWGKEYLTLVKVSCREDLTRKLNC